MKFKLTVNNQPYEFEAEDDIPLLWALRDHLDLTGTKYGCGMAQCGACTVLVDGKAKKSCTTKAKSVQGKAITTIEGNISAQGQAVKAAWDEINVHQCGYCQVGQIMAATALLATNPNPDDAAIDKAMSAVICRCGTYGRIRKGIKQAAGSVTGYVIPVQTNELGGEHDDA